MRVLVAGATGALGIRLLPLLVRAGHTVVGMTRTSHKSRLIEQMGAAAVVADGLDASAVRAAVHAVSPEVIVHEMTALRGESDLRHFDRVFAHSNRLRTEGLDHLLEAAREAGTRRIIAQSYCGWPYAREGGPVKSEEAALDAHPPAQLSRSLKAIRYLEGRLREERQLAGLSLRYGSFYGPDTGMLDKAVVDQIRHRRFPLIGGGAGWWSFVHVGDAAAATALAVERGTPGAYNIVDDEPAPVSDWLPHLAALVGAKPPVHLPAWIARFVAGEHLVAMMTEVRAGSNAKAKRELGWLPEHPSWRLGFADALREGAAAAAA